MLSVFGEVTLVFSILFQLLRCSHVFEGYPALACGMLFLITSDYCWHILASFYLSVIWRWGQEEELCFLSLRWQVAVQSPTGPGRVRERCERGEEHIY